MGYDSFLIDKHLYYYKERDENADVNSKINSAIGAI